MPNVSNNNFKKLIIRLAFKVKALNTKIPAQVSLQNKKGSITTGLLQFCLIQTLLFATFVQTLLAFIKMNTFHFATQSIIA